MKLEKSIWTESDFESMGWHDSTLYSISFDYKKHGLLLDIDYIFEWSANLDSYRVAAAKLAFYSVHDLVINIDFSSNLQAIIESISKSDTRNTPSGLYQESKYTITTDVGTIQLFAIGFEQSISRAPTWLATQDIGRDYDQLY